MSIGQNPITKLPQKYCSDKLEVRNSEQVSKKSLEILVANYQKTSNDFFGKETQ